MSFRPLTETERQETLQAIGEVKKEMAGRQQYLSELENRLIKGAWTWDITQDELETIQFKAEYDIVWFDQMEQERDAQLGRSLWKLR